MTDLPDELHEARAAVRLLQRELRAGRQERTVLTANFQQAEKAYRNVFEIALDGMFQSTAEGRFRVASAVIELADSLHRTSLS